MNHKPMILAEDGDAIASFVLNIEQKTGKALKSIHIRRLDREPERPGETRGTIDDNVSIEFFNPPLHTYCRRLS